MAEQTPAEFAYMIPIIDGVVPDGNPERPSLPCIYKIRADKVWAFKRKMDEVQYPGTRWAVLYHVYPMTETEWS